MTTPPSVALVTKDLIAPIPEIPQPRKIRRSARRSVKRIRRRLSKRIIAKGRPSRAAPKKKVVIDKREKVLEEEQRFWDYDDLDDWGTAEPDDSSKASCTEHPPPDL
ncbi:hypothetical protein PIB30_047462 [Stylosanthes scabra]|uniref:Uncharacterized protein n=1 Tax=Stylosanthes scabra TaxID=79078 RepID=A0ABU6YF03_9FABA|nr:hypothetical protein [Stylosanthes scabra]